MVNSNDESADRDSEESESSIAGSEDVPGKHMTEASEAEEGNQALLVHPDSKPELSLEEPEGQQDEGVAEDQLGTNLPIPLI